MNTTQVARKKSWARYFAVAVLILTSLCLGLVIISFIVNRGFPTHSKVTDRLTPVDKARIAEVFHLRQELGENVLPGWSQADIPLILYNEEYLFLIGYPDPPAGWRKVPQGTQHGAAWLPVPDDDFEGQPYYRQKLPGPGQNSQAFTVWVGERWVASLPTYEWGKIYLAESLRQDLPAPLKPIFPYPVMVSLMMPGSDAHITLVLHEAAHAYQGIRAADRLVEAERVNTAHGKAYPWESAAFKDAWQVELNLLNEAARASSEQETRRLAGEFLAQRSGRRQAAALSAELVNFERQREWEEGIAKYSELWIYRQASSAPGYQPVAALAQDAEFHRYQGAQRKWDQEISQIRLTAGMEGDGRFYYSGFAQAVLLDRLSPGWKARLFEPGVWLEDLLRKSLENQ